MARGSTLLTLRTMLKAECGYNLTTGVATAKDGELNQLLANMQQFLWNKYKWPFLHTHEDINLVANTRYYNYPTIVSLDVDPSRVETKYALEWTGLDYGITGQDYEQVDPEQGQTMDPVCKWQIYSATQFEVWPMPATAQTLRFWGTKTLTGFLTAGVFDDTKTADLDDLLIVLFLAAELVSRSSLRDAQTKLARANEVLQRLRGSLRSDTKFTMSGKDSSTEFGRDRNRRYIGIAVNK